MTQPLVNTTSPQSKQEQITELTKLFYTPAHTTTSQKGNNLFALIGAPGTGKTTSLLTFSNRLWLDFDHKIPPGEQSIEFWNSNVIDKIAKRTFAEVPNVLDAVRIWLRTNHNKFHPKQTIIIDSFTNLVDSADLQIQAMDRALEKPNKFFAWKIRGEFYKEIFAYLRACPAKVVVVFHETVDREEDGTLNGKLRPCVDGGYKDKILGNFSNVWRQLSNIYIKNQNGSYKYNPDGSKILHKVTYKDNPNWVWFWQFLGDSVIDLNCEPELNRKLREKNISMLPADYAEIDRIMNEP